MKKPLKENLKKRALVAVRDYGVQLTLFRNAMREVHGRNVTEMECLRLLYLKGVATPSELSRYAGLTSGATTAMLDRLENAGLIERQPNPDDRRGTLIIPVESGREKMAAGFEASRKAQDELLSSYSEEQLEIISAAFEQFANLWKQETENIQKMQ